MTKTVAYHWHLRQLMNEHDMHATTDLVPLLADRPLVPGPSGTGPSGTGPSTTGPSTGGGPAAYVCRGFVCERPVTTASDLAAALAG